MAYIPLFSIHAEHQFFSSGMCENIEFQPTGKSAALMAQAGLINRNTDSSIHIYRDTEKEEALNLCIDDPDDPLVLDFKVWTRDRLFANYTDLGASKRDDSSILYFDNQPPLAGLTGNFRLHANEYVSERDFLSMKSPNFKDILASRDRLIKPVFVVSIRVRPQDLVENLSPTEGRKKRYFICFKVRDTIWKYFLQGDLKDKELIIVDQENTVEFEAAGQERLANGKIARVIRSKQRLALAQKSTFRFQLKENGTANPKILFKRLPVASSKQIQFEQINNVESIVSEIYIA